jgi:hypothetical protein
MTPPIGSARAKTQRRSPNSSSPSDERLHPITVEGVTTFPVCPSAAMLAHRRNQTDMNYQRSSNQWRQRRFQMTRSFTIDDADDDEEIAVDDMGTFLTTVSNDDIYDGNNSYYNARFDCGSNDTTVRSLTSFRLDNRFFGHNSTYEDCKSDEKSFLKTRYFIARRYPSENDELSAEDSLT